MTVPPTLESERLRLRPHRASDFSDCLALWSDARTVRFIGGQVHDAQAVWFRMLRYAGMWSLLGFGYWVFEDKVTGRYLGEGGLADVRRGIKLLDGVPEIGWALVPGADGQGLASEAVRAVAAWSDAVLEAPLTRCIIDRSNVASLRVAEKSGYTPIEIMKIDKAKIIVLERARTV